MSNAAFEGTVFSAQDTSAPENNKPTIIRKIDFRLPPVTHPK